MKLSSFVLSAEDTQVPRVNKPGPRFVNHWGGVQDSEMQLYLRTGPDSSVQMIDLTIHIPIKNNGFIVFNVKQTPSGEVKMMMIVRKQVIFSTNLDMSTAFQHIRFVWRGEMLNRLLCSSSG